MPLPAGPLRPHDFSKEVPSGLGKEGIVGLVALGAVLVLLAYWTMRGLLTEGRRTAVVCDPAPSWMELRRLRHQTRRALHDPDLLAQVRGLLSSPGDEQDNG